MLVEVVTLLGLYQEEPKPLRRLTRQARQTSPKLVR